MYASPNAKKPFIKQKWLMVQPETDLNRPKLKNATMALYRPFWTAFIIYKVIELISVKARQGLIVHLKMDINNFNPLTDEKFMGKLDKHFIMEDISNYRSSLLKLMAIICRRFYRPALQ